MSNWGHTYPFHKALTEILNPCQSSHTVVTNRQYKGAFIRTRYEVASCDTTLQLDRGRIRFESFFEDKGLRREGTEEEAMGFGFH